MKQFRHGFIVGKFMPLHNGHVFLIERALEQSERVTVCLMSRNDEPIAGVVRLGWLRELFGETCTIVHHTAELPQDASGYGHWEEWLQSIRTICPAECDAVFSSERYGERLAQDLGAMHVMVDEARILVPVSGTKIRANTSTHYQYLPLPVQQFYKKQSND